MFVASFHSNPHEIARVGQLRLRDRATHALLRFAKLVELHL